jgi:hypothetical protein
MDQGCQMLYFKNQKPRFGYILKTKNPNLGIHIWYIWVILTIEAPKQKRKQSLIY